MKRFVVLVLCICIIALTASEALAKPFTTRKGIAFGMDYDSVISAEADQKLTPKEGSSGSQAVFDENILYAKIPAVLTYDFDDGKMNQMTYLATGEEKEYKAIKGQATKDFGKPVQDGIGEMPPFVTPLYGKTDKSTVTNYTHWHTTFDDYDVIVDLWETQDNQIILAVSWADQAETHSTLKSGSKGAGVKTIQEYLINYGYLEGEATGNFDGKTVKALKDFQICNGMKETGICDAVVWECLQGRPVYQDIVYKSKKGKVYHSKSNCSGMKNPRVMKLSDALRKGLRPCSHCH